MSSSLRPQEPADVSNQNVTLIGIMRCLREYFGLYHLNGKNYLCTPGILFIWASLAQPPSHKLSGEESWWFFSTAIMGVIYYLKSIQIHSKVFWTNAEWSISTAGGLGCRHLSGYICNSARQQVHSCPRLEEFWRKVVPGVLYFTLGTAKACLAQTDGFQSGFVMLRRW